jgi:hypothetical protein
MLSFIWKKIEGCTALLLPKVGAKSAPAVQENSAVSKQVEAGEIFMERHQDVFDGLAQVS